MSLRAKLTFWFFLFVAALLTLFCLAIFYFYESSREAVFVRRLENKAITTCRLLFDINEVNVELLHTIDRLDLTSLYDEKVSIFTSKNEMAYTSDDDPIDISPKMLDEIRKKGKIDIIDQDKESIGLVFRDNGAEYVVVISAIDRYGLDRQSVLKIILLAGWGLGLLATIFAGRLFASWAMRPIEKLNHEVSQIDAANLDTRVEEGNGRDEISKLAVVFNRLMDRLRSTFDSQRAFVSNASHELRTPLTAMRGQIEVSLAKKRPTEEYVQLLHSLLDDLKNLSRLFNGLLDLAKAGLDASALQFEPTRIDELLWEVSGNLAKMQPEYRITIDFEHETDDENLLFIQANPPLLSTAFLNLMENGCKYSDNQSVAVFIDSQPDKLTIRFADKGKGIDPEDMEQIFNPFFRSQSVKHQIGHGLGLPLVQKIVQLHRGQISVQSTPGKGTTVTLVFPIRKLK